MKCPWHDSAPAGLCDAAEGWGMTRLPDVFHRAHARFKNHDDGAGRCKVCGGPMDLEAWLDEQDAPGSASAAADEPGERE